MIIFGEVTKKPTFLIFFNGAAWKVGRSCTIFSQYLFPFWLKTLVKLLHSLVNFSLNDKNIFKPDCSPCVHTGNLNTTYYQKLIRHHHQMIHRHASYLHLYKSPLLLGGSNNIKKNHYHDKNVSLHKWGVMTYCYIFKRIFIGYDYEPQNDSIEHKLR